MNVVLLVTGINLMCASWYLPSSRIFLSSILMVIGAILVSIVANQIGVK